MSEEQIERNIKMLYLVDVAPLYRLEYQPLEELVKLFNGYIEKAEVDGGDSPVIEFGCNFDYSVYYSRPETDDELEERRIKLNRDVETQKNRKLREYERLKEELLKEGLIDV